MHGKTFMTIATFFGASMMASDALGAACQPTARANMLASVGIGVAITAILSWKFIFRLRLHS